jgi:hypothetical protein
MKAVIFLPTMSRQEISTRQKAEPGRRCQPKPATSLSTSLLAANVADVEVIVLTGELAHISFERAGIFNT